MTIVPNWAKHLPLELINANAERFKMPPELIAAVIQTESAGNTYATRFEPAYRYAWEVRNWADKIGMSIPTMEISQKTSWGLMQIMYSVALEHGYGGWPAGLCTPELGIMYGCMHLRQKYQKYGPDPARTYASYNAGSIITTPGGMFHNQSAVDRFMKFYRELTEIEK